MSDLEIPEIVHWTPIGSKKILFSTQDQLRVVSTLVWISESECWEASEQQRFSGIQEHIFVVNFGLLHPIEILYSFSILMNRQIQRERESVDGPVGWMLGPRGGAVDRRPTDAWVFTHARSEGC